MPERSLRTKCPAGFWDQEGDKEMPRAGSQRLTLGNVTADEGDGGGGRLSSVPMRAGPHLAITGAQGPVQPWHQAMDPKL